MPSYEAFIKMGKQALLYGSHQPCYSLFELHWHPPDLLRFATQQYHELAGEAQLLYDLKDVFKLLNILLQEAQLSVLLTAQFKCLQHVSSSYEPISSKKRERR